MSGVVLDASAVLALLLDERGAEQVASSLDEAAISAVNLAEVVSHYAKVGSARQDIEQMLSPLPLQVVQADRALAIDAGLLRPATLSAGLSLGDRFCLALARRMQRPTLTADRAWTGLAERIGVEIVLLR
jgi:PIN domain nuclease of toxin-antitoxin system